MKFGWGIVYFFNLVDDFMFVCGIGINFIEFGEVGGIIFLFLVKG